MKSSRERLPYRIPFCHARENRNRTLPDKAKPVAPTVKDNDMAQKIHIVLEDDLDGGEAAETVTFGLDGTSYEIDLSDKNAAALRDALSTYVGHGRKVGASPRRGRKQMTSTDLGPSAREVRDWARSNGHSVPDRGRIPSDVREAFDAAH